MSNIEVIIADNSANEGGGVGSGQGSGTSDSLSDPALLVINCALYDPKFKETVERVSNNGDGSSVSLLDWANAWTPLPPGQEYLAYSTEEEWQRLIATIQADPDKYGSIMIEDVGQRSGGGNMATFTYGDTTIVGFEGTHGEWPDNGDGGHWDETETEVQKVILVGRTLGVLPRPD